MADDVAFNIAVYAKTDVGMVRPGNEDSFLVVNLSTADTWTPETAADDLTGFPQSHFGCLLAVTDGMGGALAGEVASRLAVECVRDRMLEIQSSATYSKFPFSERLRLSIELANLYIYQMGLKRPEYTGMGATFTAVGLSGTTAYFAQVGDSRAYVIRSGRVQQITKDQSLVGHLLEAGHITEEEAERHTYKNVILQALGASPFINVAVDRLALHDMDVVVLCSDGLSNKVRNEEIEQTVEGAGSLKEACESLILLANSRGGEDNITALAAQFAGGKLSEEAAAARAADTALLTVPTERWGAESVPRDEDLPAEINAAMLEEEEDTIPPADDVADENQ